MNDIIESVHSGSVCMYADDSSEYCIWKNIDEVVSALNQSLIKQYAGCAKNKLTPHPTKLSRYIHLNGLKKNFANKQSLIRKSIFLPKQVLLNLYFEVMYGISVWAGMSR